MAGHVTSRNLLVYTIPAVIAILSLIWFRKRRQQLSKDPSLNASSLTHCKSPAGVSVVCSKSLEEDYVDNTVFDQSSTIEIRNETTEIFKEDSIKPANSYIVESGINQNCSVVCESTETEVWDIISRVVENTSNEFLPNANDSDDGKTIQYKSLLPSLINSNYVDETKSNTLFHYTTSVDENNTLDNIDSCVHLVTSENESYSNSIKNHEIQISTSVSHGDNSNTAQSLKLGHDTSVDDENETDLDLTKNISTKNIDRIENHEESIEQSCLYGETPSSFENELSSVPPNTAPTCSSTESEISRNCIEINEKELITESNVTNALSSETDPKLDSVPAIEEVIVKDSKSRTFHTPVTVHSFSAEHHIDASDSPPYGTYSDVHSEGSSDSGKGGSDLSHNTGSEVTVYEFELPQDLCGRLIGKMGKQVKYIKDRSNANIFIKRHPFSPTLKLCAIEGSLSEIHNALDLIRKKFPPSQFPAVTLTQVNVPTTCGIPIPETLQLHLPEGVTCNVILSSLVSAGHFFLQQPTHPTYPSLSQLDQCMLACYSQMDTPQLPQPIETGIICAATIMNGWYRAQVVNVYEATEECDVKFVDYGGYSQVPNSSLRQIRSDFMTLPFQASECYLSNVKPVDEESGWSLEACAAFEELAQGQILQSVIVSYAEDGIPYVQLYRIQGVSTMFVNRELVNRGVAQWVEHQV